MFVGNDNTLRRVLNDTADLGLTLAPGLICALFFFAQFFIFQRARDRRPQMRQAVLAQIVGRALFHHRYRAVFVNPRRDDNEWDIQFALLQKTQRPQPVELRQPIAGEYEV